MKKRHALLPALCLGLLLSGCATGIDSAAAPSAQSATQIKLLGGGAEISGGGASCSGGLVTISAAGVYSLSGDLNEGQVVVNTGEDAGIVTIYLDGATLSNSADAALCVAQAEYVRLVTTAGSENFILSGTPAEKLSAAAESANGAALFSEDDLILDGEGSLSISGYINNAVTCKDDLEIVGGRVTLIAANNALRGSESVTVSGGAVTIDCMNDALKATSADKPGKGYVALRGGEVTVSAGGDGISAVADVNISGGSLTVTAAKDGIKAGEKNSGQGDVTISGGDLTISAGEDGIDARGKLSVTGGRLLSLGNSKRMKGFSPDSSQSYLELELPAAGALPLSLSFQGDTLAEMPEPGYAYNIILFSDPALNSGESYSVSYGDRTEEAAAK